MNTFFKMIERLEDLVLSGIGVPLTPMTVINSEKVVPLLDRIREALPEEIKQAQRINEQREQMVADAQYRANQLLQDAKNQAEFMLSESELLKAVNQEIERARQQILAESEGVRKKAFEEAEAMKAKAYEEARAVREGADQYAASILMSLDKSLTEFHSAVRTGQKHLKRTRHEAHAQAHNKVMQQGATASMPVLPHQQPAPVGSAPAQVEDPASAYIAPMTYTQGYSAASDDAAIRYDRQKEIENFLKQTTVAS